MTIKLQKSAATRKKLTIMVSSTVYGIEELLDRIYTLLTVFGRGRGYQV